jgi:hypothetical protein
MSDHGRKSCFISAPFGFDTAPLIQALSARNVAPGRLDNLEPGDELIARIQREIRRADFVCIVLPGGYSQSNAVFEAGLALGTGRPLLILAESDVNVPFELQHLNYVRTSLRDNQALGDVLNVYLPRILQRGPARRTPHPPSLKLLGQEDADGALSILRAPQPPNGAELRQSVAEVFQKVGIRTAPSPAADRGADLAIWIDETQSIFGNPVLVEIKAGRLSQAQIDEVYHRLSQQLIRANLLLGIIIYWDTQGKKLKVAAPTLPLVVCLSVEELVDSLRLGMFARTLLDIRNRAVHGVVA